MIWEGLNLMLIGMGTVYLFLILLVFCTRLMSRVIGRYFPEAVQPLPPPQTGAPATGSVQNELTAAITAAVHHHRQRR